MTAKKRRNLPSTCHSDIFLFHPLIRTPVSLLRGEHPAANHLHRGRGPQIECDVQPTYVRLTIKGKVLHPGPSENW